MESTLEMLSESVGHNAESAAVGKHTVQEQLGTLALYVANHSDEDVVVYSGNIGHPSDRLFSESILRNKEHPNVLLILTTYGGVPDSAFRMARVLQQNYKKITVYVNDFCKSSGTLLAIGADQIVMGDFGEFGPLDIQLVNRDEFNERNSGLDAIQALSLLSEQSSDLLKSHFVSARMGGRLGTKQALDVATNTTVGLLGPIYGQLEPLRLGEISRSMRIAYDYGDRLNRGNLKPNALQQLIGSYPSHGYVIDEMEAEDRIFNKVRKPLDYEKALWGILNDFIKDRIGSDQPLLLHLNEFIEDEVENSSVQDNNESMGVSEDTTEDTTEDATEDTTEDTTLVGVVSEVVKIGSESASQEETKTDGEQHASNE